MSDVYHQELEHQAREHKQHFHDQVGGNLDHPTARLIYNNMQRVEDMAQQGHNLRGIRDQIRTTERLIEQAKHTPSGYISTEHANDTYHRLRNWGDEIGRHPDFQ